VIPYIPRFFKNMSTYKNPYLPKDKDISSDTHSHFYPFSSSSLNPKPIAYLTYFPLNLGRVFAPKYVFYSFPVELNPEVLTNPAPNSMPVNGVIIGPASKIIKLSRNEGKKFKSVSQFRYGISETNY
jgi:hypothetical protein